MNNQPVLITSKAGNHYIYSDRLQYFSYVPPEMENVLMQRETEKTDSQDYYERKYQFLKKHHFFEKEKVVFKTDYAEELVRKNLACLRQLLIEVTDFCNLRCKYCGYGEFYSNYDIRETHNQTFENVKKLIDLLAELWKSDYNTSYNNTVIVGFYGGEPLLNMPLIRKTIEYVESLHIKDLTFSYNMTTNAMLLDRYMDFLVEKNFSILISLDGGEYQSGYRVDKNGNPSFHRVIKNVQRLRETYPHFFEENVKFNAVLHDRNSVEECFQFIYGTFGKTPMISELNVNGIVKERQDEFFRMFNSKVQSFRKAFEDEDIKEAFQMESSDSIHYHTMLMNYVGDRYLNYVDLFDSPKKNKYIPTGTCRPFERKLFLTVNGKILPCEKIGQECAVGNLSNIQMELNCAQIAQQYSQMYKRVVINCNHCQHAKRCGQCMFLLKEKDGKLLCHGMHTEKMLQKEFTDFLTYAEEHPGDYEKLLSSIVID